MKKKSVQDTSTEKLSALLQVEWDIRQAPDDDSLSFIAVNECKRLVTYDYAVLWRQPKRSVIAISGVASIEANAPMVEWCNRLVEHLFASNRAKYPSILDEEMLPDSLKEGWKEWSHGGVMWRPMIAGQRGVNGGLLFFRAPSWNDGELYIISRLANALAQSFALIDAHSGWHLKHLLAVFKSKPVVAGLVVLIIAALFLPVQITVLAPAQVTAQTPYVVSSPIDGVIEDFLILPNTPVEEGQPLFRFVAVGLKAANDIAEKALALAEEELDVARKQAFADPEAKANLAVLEAKLEEKRAEYAHAAEQFAWIEVASPASGIAIFDDPDDWKGRPVRIGEKILTVADSSAVALDVQLPVDDAIVVEPGRRVTLYLNTRPLEPVEARLERAGYLPAVQPDGVVAYQLRAVFVDLAAPPRIGLKGTAKLYGQEVSLFYFLMRRPLAALRRTFGW